MELLEEIGSGTCGVVNKMFHPATNTTMAVKVLIALQNIFDFSTRFMFTILKIILRIKINL